MTTLLLYHTDDHIKRVNPASRVDDYFEAMLRKQAWLTDFGNKKGVDLFVSGGDLFDLPVQSILEINRVYDIWKKRKARTLGVIGNHPIRGDSEAWKPHSGIQTLQDLGVLEIRDAFKADIEVDGVLFRLDHTDLVRLPVPWPHTLWKDYDPGNADVVLISHYHPQQGVHTLVQNDREAIYASPGAVSRGALAEDNLKRKPACLLIEVDHCRLKSIEIINIPHEPSEVVFREKTSPTVRDVEAESALLARCLDSLKNWNDEGFLAPDDLLRIVAEQKKSPREVLDMALHRLKETR